MTNDSDIHKRQNQGIKAKDLLENETKGDLRVAAPGGAHIPLSGGAAGGRHRPDI